MRAYNAEKFVVTGLVLLVAGLVLAVKGSLAGAIPLLCLAVVIGGTAVVQWRRN